MLSVKYGLEKWFRSDAVPCLAKDALSSFSGINIRFHHHGNDHKINHFEDWDKAYLPCIEPQKMDGN